MRTVRMHRVVMVAMLLFACTIMHAQETTVPAIKLVNPTSKQATTIMAPSGISASQTYQLPAATGAANQVMTATSVSGGVHAFGWTTASSGGAATSDRATADITYTRTAMNNGLGVAVLANKTYRIVGVLLLNRTNDASATVVDQFRIEVTAPSGSTRTWFGVQCYNCPTGTTGVPTAAQGTASATTANINPEGGTANYTTYAYSLEGVVDVGSGDGTVYVRIIDYSTNDSTNPLVINTQSYIVLTEIE